MDNKKTNVGWGVIFSVAAVWFGTHVGGGFATGNQTMQYFVGYGWPTVFMPFLIICLLGWCYYNGTVMAKNHQAFRYDELAQHLYSPFGTAGKIFFDIAFFILVVVGAGIAIAGAGSLFENLFGLNYYIGIIGTGLIFFVLTIFGADLVRKSSTIISLFILVALLCLLVPGLSSGAANLKVLLSEGYMEGSWLDCIWKGLLYAGFQSLVVASIISTSQPLKTSKSCARFAIMGVVLNGVMIALCAIMLLSYMPGIKENTLPILEIAKQQNIGLLTVAYSVSLFGAFVTTGVGVVFGLVARFENVVLTGVPIVQRRMLISFLALLVSVIMSVVGLTKLVAVGYGWIGRVCVFFLVIPLAIIAPIKNRKFKKEHPEVE
ncbi:MAG: beta-carotene 15,15'-monooxygenase [Ndongobacter sp.]|nr:beta-carotene 15,15'-monooxygenase [Ndongobacter sp.]